MCSHSIMYLFFIYINIPVWLSMRVSILFQKATKSMTCKLYFWKPSHNFWGMLQFWSCPVPWLLSPGACPRAWPQRCWRAAAPPGQPHCKLRTETLERRNHILLQSHLYLSCSVTMFAFRFTTALLRGVNPCAPTGWLMADSHVSYLASSLHRGSLALVGCCY